MDRDAKLGKRLSTGDVTEAELLELHRSLAGEDLAMPEFPADIALRAAQFGYFKWPWKLRKYALGRRVLDVGSGQGTDGIGFITLGASAYCGADTGAGLNKDKTKHKNVPKLSNSAQKLSFGWTPLQIMEAFDGRIRVLQGTTTDLLVEGVEKFGVVSMHTVTEHLMDLAGVFAECRALMEDDGYLIFLHDNFYSWNGHHMMPKNTAQLDETNPEHMQYADWNHLTFDPPQGHYFTRGLNKIRLDELKQVTEQYFWIETWNETENDYGRLTDEILARHSAYTRRDLVVNKVFCVARPKPS